MIPYTVHDKEALIQEAANEGATVFFFEFGKLLFGIKYTPNMFGKTLASTHHFGFHAMSHGFEKYTRTGYHSIFLSGNGVINKEEVENYFVNIIEKSSGIDLNNQLPQQLSLF